MDNLHAVSLQDLELLFATGDRQLSDAQFHVATLFWGALIAPAIAADQPILRRIIGSVGLIQRERA